MKTALLGLAPRLLVMSALLSLPARADMCCYNDRCYACVWTSCVVAGDPTVGPEEAAALYEICVILHTPVRKM